MSSKPPKTQYRKLRRPEAQMLANHIRAEKIMDLPNGWVTFYRLTPEEIVRRYPKLTLEAVVKGARLETEEVEPA